MNGIYLKRKTENLCVYCGKYMDRKGYYCNECTERWSKYKHNYTLTTHEKGKCTNCYNDLDREGWFCNICVNKLRLRGKALADFRRVNGLCVQCGVNVEEYKYCQKCRDERMERYYAKKGM